MKMNKTMFLSLIIILMSSTLNARYLNSGIAMCKTSSSMREVVNNSMKDTFWGVWGKLTSQGLCSENPMLIREDSTNRFETLSGGITKVNFLYFATSDIRDY